MKRKELTNTQWERLQPLLPLKNPNRLARFGPSSDHQWHLVDAAPRRPWRDLPERYGPWGTVASRFYRWRKAGIWQRLFEPPTASRCAGKMNWAIHHVDGTIVRAHQHAAGSPNGAEAEALGRSQGGFSTKVHLRAAGEKR
jgi:transposase